MLCFRGSGMPDIGISTIHEEFGTHELVLEDRAMRGSAILSRTLKMLPLGTATLLALAQLSFPLAAKEKSKVYPYHGQVDACRVVESTRYNLYNGRPMRHVENHLFAHNADYAVEVVGPCLPLGAQFSARLEDTRRGQRLYIQNGSKEISYWLVSSQLRHPN